ncbi:MAG: hypothetical protein ACE147_18760 [Candidatus Methylomirabilales bacterium]
MVAPILELRPSATGWYLPRAARPGGAAPARPRPAAASQARLDLPGTLFLGYGPDGRPRPAPARPRLSLLA